MALTSLYIHGAGRRGSEAWPHVAEADGEFVSFATSSTIDQQVDELVVLCAGRRTLLYGHSIGAVPAVLAASSGRMDVAGLVLVEPALYDIARGEESIERHVAAVSEARSQAAIGDLQGSWAILRPLMFGGPFDAAAWERERPVAEHWSRTTVPWGHGIRASMVASIPTLVVTGGWNDEYETIAGVLVDHGASHHLLRGHQHRPQDAPGFLDVVTPFVESLTG